MESPAEKQLTDTLSVSGLERRLKRRFLKAPHRFFAVTTPGLEEILKAEVALLPDVTMVQSEKGGVHFCGPFQTVYHAHLRLRTANRVLLRVDSFTARSYPELYSKAKRIMWELYCGFDPAVSFEASSRSSRLHHTGNVADAVFTACAEHMAKLGQTMTPKPDAAVRFLVRYADDRCTVSVNASGELLHKRGYRQEIGHAPLRETTAAALLEAAQWRNFGTIADPLCGSGTFLVESALMAVGRPPGLHRSYAFMHWPSFKPTLWERLRLAAEQSTVRPLRIIGSDISETAVDQAFRNAQRAGVAAAIELTRRDCFAFNLKGEAGTSGLIISNLPYGKRAFAHDDAIHDFYARWGGHLKRFCHGWGYGFLSVDESFCTIAGLRPGPTLRFENGGIKVQFVTGRVL
jgi:putative N6-adenine-specific DNA methylase